MPGTRRDLSVNVLAACVPPPTQRDAVSGDDLGTRFTGWRDQGWLAAPCVVHFQIRMYYSLD